MVIAVWRRTWIFYVIAGFSWIIFGFGYFSSDIPMSVLTILVGIACFAGAKWDKGKGND